MVAELPKCHHCSAELGHAEAVHILPTGVTSDCQPWDQAVRICACPSCGAAQAPIDDAWRRDVDAIYRAYDTYAAAGGEEQKVIGEDAGGMRARSRVIVEWLASAGLSPKHGDVLDVGCGRGAFLGAFSSRFPDWGLNGTEFDDRNSAVLRELPKFNALQTSRFEELSGEYDLISMIHVLEHIENPVVCLRALRQRACAGALLLVQVPDWSENPFALAIADHATHFTPGVLEQVARRSGWEPVFTPGHVVPKELTLLARAGAVDDAPVTAVGESTRTRLAERLSWLRTVQQRAHELRAHSPNFGIFGTAVAGTWLAGACGGVDFFVDEDPSRVGRRHLGIPILSPNAVPPDSDVFVGMAPAVSNRLAGKYADAPARFHAVDSVETP